MILISSYDIRGRLPASRFADVVVVVDVVFAGVSTSHAKISLESKTNYKFLNNVQNRSELIQ